MDVTEPDVAAIVREAMEIALPADTFANMVMLAMSQSGLRSGASDGLTEEVALSDRRQQ